MLLGIASNSDAELCRSRVLQFIRKIVSLVHICNLRHEAVLIETRSNLLKDQLVDLEYQTRNKRTYEEGLKDGFENSQIPDFVRGYHYATKN